MIDAIDRKILSILQDNARTPNTRIAEAVGMAPSAVLERVRKLERKGLIQGYHAKINHTALNLGLTAFIFVRVDEAVGANDTGGKLAVIPGVLEVHYCAGQAHYLVKVRVADTEQLARMIAAIGRVETVRDTNSTIVLRTMRETTNLPLNKTMEEETP